LGKFLTSLNPNCAGVAASLPRQTRKFQGTRQRPTIQIQHHQMQGRVYRCKPRSNARIP
jgi:hypothetical protein